MLDRPEVVPRAPRWRRKEICGPRDLAINGAPPAFDEPLHVGRPNIGDRHRYLALMGEILDRRWLSNNGPLVQEFERLVRDRLGVRNVVAVSNGTIALEIAIRALELSGEVILPSYTFVATAHAVHWQGITPVFADIDPGTHCIDPESVERLVTPRTTGVIGVHLWGRAAPVGDLEALCARRGLKLLFDAAHAFGCSLGNQPIGNFGSCEVFSFHATKFLNSHEGGAIATNDDALAEKLRLMRNFGFAGEDNVIHPGTNGKMVEACAAMGIVNLESSDRFVEANRRNHCAYAHALAGLLGISIVQPYPDAQSNWQYVVVEVGDETRTSRDALVAALRAENVLARRYFWPGCHRMKPYRDLFPWADTYLANTRSVADRVIVLPTGMAVGVEEIAVIGQVFRALVA